MDSWVAPVFTCFCTFYISTLSNYIMLFTPPSIIYPVSFHQSLTYMSFSLQTNTQGKENKPPRSLLEPMLHCLKAI